MRKKKGLLAEPGTTAFRTGRKGGAFSIKKESYNLSLKR